MRPHLNSRLLYTYRTHDTWQVVADADCIIMCTPHQYLYNICKSISGKVKKDAMAISLVKV